MIFLSSYVSPVPWFVSSRNNKNISKWYVRIGTIAVRSLWCTSPSKINQIETAAPDFFYRGYSEKLDER
ncbi:hypothetical protein DHW03_13870 [Pedobacter yonginense]|uniref:Uncharacterized protein n=1 Tax=Pedobacter yonginense TaxID=651869 RepID=A0A317EJT5_9SPHI|nr:hypothetical protein DHW03_13870 [Pedobacter yonginense]